MAQPREKTLIGVLASHDSVDRNKALKELFDKLAGVPKTREKLKKFHFLFTGGTYERLIDGSRKPDIEAVKNETKKFLLEDCGITKLPSGTAGGVTVLAHLIVQQTCSIIWPFLTPLTGHWLLPENLALIRLCDQWHVKKLMNPGSVYEWVNKEAQIDTWRNPQELPIPIVLFKDEAVHAILGTGLEHILAPEVQDFPEEDEYDKMTVALIAHDEMKGRMIEFAIDFERELDRFGHILSTGTTGREIEANTRRLEQKIYRYRSGPKGGDIEIATQVLFGRCHVVIFFIDPLNPHPHIEDIRVVLGACMMQDQVRMLTNEMQAREWMRRVMRA